LAVVKHVNKRIELNYYYYVFKFCKYILKIPLNLLLVLLFRDHFTTPISLQCDFSVCFIF
jgi:hypothetical protein